MLIDDSIRYVVFDVDDVVVDTDSACSFAERAVAEPLLTYFSPAIAQAVSASLTASYQVLLGRLRQSPGADAAAFDRLEKRIRGWQGGVISAGFDFKLWSRDVMIAIALEDLGLKPTREVVGAAESAYWRVMTEKTRIYEDARVLIGALRARNIVVHLATNSDGFLRFDEANQTFLYDPTWAIERKHRRLALLEALDLFPRDISVGDPVGKPKRGFFEKVLAEMAAKIGAPVIVEQVLAVGDSLTNDVLPLIELGAKAGVWLVRSDPHADEPCEGHPSVRRCGTLRVAKRSI